MATVTYSWSNVVGAFFVNDQITAGVQSDPAVAAFSDGRFFATWTSGTDVEGRVINDNGIPVAAEFAVNSTIANSQFSSSAAGLLNGNAVVTFTDFSADPGGDIRARLFNSNGTPIGNDFLIASGTDDQRKSDVAALGNGGFVVTWTRDAGGGDFDLQAQTFNAAGTAVSGVITVDNSAAFTTNFPSVVGLADGGFVVVWQQTPVGGGNQQIWFQRYDASNLPQGSHVPIDISGSLNNDVHVVGLQDGGFAVAYTDNGWGLDQTEISFTIFNANGTNRLGTLIRVNDVTTGAQNNSSITVLSNGFIDVAFSSGDSLIHQAYTPNGVAAGSNFTAVASVVEGEVAALGGGLVANVHSSTFPDTGGDNSIRTQINALVRTTIGDSTGEVLIGDSLRDTINGNDGADTLLAGAGDDLAVGGAGDDVILGEDGNDTLAGDDGNDRINAGGGADVIFGGTGNDELGAGSGDDIIVGQEGDDLIFGEDGIDVANGGAGNDIMLGGLGNDTFGGGADNDVVIGGDGDDLLFGEDGVDSMNGEVGNDGVVGGAGNDLLGGGVGDDIVVGDGGDDVLFGEVGNDAMNGGFGNDTVLGGNGDDTVGGGAGDDTVVGEFGNDVLFGENGNDLLNGGAGNDIFVGGGNDDVFVFGPGDGADTIVDFFAGDFFAGTPEDRIWFAGTDLHSFADVQSHAVTVAGNTVITYNGFFTVTLNGVTTGQLTAGDFIFS